MSMSDKLTSLYNRIISYQASIEKGYAIFSNGTAFTVMTDTIISILGDFRDLIDSVVTDGYPYPASNLAAVHAVSDHVDLQWVAGRGNVDYQRVFRKDTGEWVQVGADLAADATTFTDTTVVPGTAYQYKVVAYNFVANPRKQIFQWDASAVAAIPFPAEIIASVVDAFCFVAPQNGRVKNVNLYLEDTGADAMDPLSLLADVKVGGFTVLTTPPVITKDANDRSSTLLPGAGITQPEIDNKQNSFTLGARVAVDLYLVRTTPDVEMAGAMVLVEVEFGNPSASDDSNLLTVQVPMVVGP